MSGTGCTTRRAWVAPLALATALAAAPAGAPAGGVRAEGLNPAQVASMRAVRAVELSPDGRYVAVTVSVPRLPGVDEDGPAWSELHVTRFADGPTTPYVYGEVNVSGVRFSPDGAWITYVAKRKGDEKAALWAVPLAGGESRRLLRPASGLGAYRLSPDGSRVAYVAPAPESAARKEARGKGFDQVVFEEDLRPARLWIAPLPPLAAAPPAPWDGDMSGREERGAPRALDIDGSVIACAWFEDGERLAVTVAPTPLVDDGYMFSRVRVVDAETGETRAEIANPGKLGAVVPGPDGTRIAMIAAEDFHDPSPGRLLVAPAAGGTPRDVMPGLEAHVRAIAWRDARTVVFLCDVGVGTAFAEVDVESGARKIHWKGGTFEEPDGPVLSGLSLSRDGTRAACTGSTARHPAEVFVLEHGDTTPRRRTDVNPWLAEVALGRQEVVRYVARDGLELEGILIHPLDEARPAPLILVVHGGPESNMRNGWLTAYSRPGQMAAARGYAVFHPNYRGSTGRGVAFSKLSQGDPAGREFDDLIDAVDHLVEIGVADRDRVGVTGGSYGGYATAWLSTYYSERIRAGVMFVGVSDLVSKVLTTDIAGEIRAVHTRLSPWEKWQFRLERSPVYHAEKSRTALLIAGGTADTRLDPEQSLQLYRMLKMLGKTPVRYVQYPGEPHGNRKAAARYDFNLRLLRWFDHYLMGEGGKPPPWDLPLGTLGDAPEGEGGE